MGAIAISAMIERLRDPGLPARDILMNFHLVVRDSCGARGAPGSDSPELICLR
jgi:GntR family transcriptional regulator of arabinose operon